MDQLPRLCRICDRRFTTEQVKVLLQGYCQGMLGRQEIQEMLGIARTRFFTLLKGYQDPEGSTLSCKSATRPRLSAAAEAGIKRELLREKEIVKDRHLPISGYNYSALRDRLKKRGSEVSVTTTIRRARRLVCYKPRRKRKAHDRQVASATTPHTDGARLRIRSSQNASSACVPWSHEARVPCPTSITGNLGRPLVRQDSISPSTVGYSVLTDLERRLNLKPHSEREAARAPPLGDPGR